MGDDSESGQNQAPSEEDPYTLPFRYLYSLKCLCDTSRHLLPIFEYLIRGPEEKRERIGVMDWTDASSKPKLRQFNQTGPFTFRQLLEQPELPALTDADQVGLPWHDLKPHLEDVDGITCRVVFIEQMSRSTIEILGSAYDLDPEFWALHFALRHDEPWHWDSSQQTKPFFGLRWCRPVFVDATNFYGGTGIDDCTRGLQGNHARVIQCEPFGHPLFSFKRTLRTLLHSFKKWTDSKEVMDSPARWWCRCCLEEQVSVYLHSMKTDPETTIIIILVDKCPMKKYKVPTEPMVIDGRPLRQQDIPHKRPQDRWSLDDLWDTILDASADTNLANPLPRMVVKSALELFKRDSIAVLSRAQRLMDLMTKYMGSRKMVIANLESKSWEFALTNLQELVPILHHTLETFQAVFCALDKPPLPKLPFGLSVKLCIKRSLDMFSTEETDGMLGLLEGISTLVKETRSAYESTVALIERQYQLNEASAVKRLTELAFLFIPLSFATSIFGMQMEEFKNGVYLYQWAITSSAVLIAAYLIRWLVRTRWWKTLGHAWVQAALKLSPTHRGHEENIPTSVYISATFYPLYLLESRFINWYHNLHVDKWLERGIGLVIALVPMAISLPLIWTRDLLPQDAKISWTVFSAIVSFFFWATLIIVTDFSNVRYRDVEKFFFLKATPVLMGLSSPAVITVAWVIDMSQAARISWTVVGGVLMVGALGALSVIQAAKFR